MLYITRAGRVLNSAICERNRRIKTLHVQRAGRFLSDSITPRFPIEPDRVYTPDYLFEFVDAPAAALRDTALSSALKRSSFNPRTRETCFAAHHRLHLAASELFARPSPAPFGRARDRRAGRTGTISMLLTVQSLGQSVLLFQPLITPDR